MDPARMAAAEESVVEVAVARGLVTAVQAEAARRAHADQARGGRPGGLLAHLAKYLEPQHREELRRVYAQALERGGATADDADAESTKQLDAPSIPRTLAAS